VTGVMAQKSRATRSWGQSFTLLLPYAWLLAFFLVPFVIVLKISLSQTAIAQPPYLPLLDFSAGWAGLKAFLSGLSTES
jgi:putrescine transport system permease protein